MGYDVRFLFIVIIVIFFFFLITLYIIGINIRESKESLSPRRKTNKSYLLKCRENKTPLLLKNRNRRALASKNSESNCRSFRLKYRKDYRSSSSEEEDSSKEWCNCERGPRKKCRDSSAESVLRKKKVTVEVVKIKKQVKVKSKTKLGCDSFQTVVKFKYCHSEKHPAIFIFRGIKGLTTETSKGIASVKQEKRKASYRFISSYNKEEKTFLVTLLDLEGQVLKLKGCNKICLFLCGGKDFPGENKKEYRHPKDDHCGMCR